MVLIQLRASKTSDVVMLTVRPRYTGTTHEVEPLQSGYRLTLEYDLVSTNGETLRPIETLYSHQTKLQDLLVAWKDKAKGRTDYPTLLAYLCDSEYTSNTLSLSTLEGNDRLRAESLKDICSQIGVGLYLANLRRTRSGYSESFANHYGNSDHGIDSEDENYIDMEEIFDIDGNSVAELQIDEEEHFIQSDPFDDVDPAEEDYDEDHGYKTEVYRATVSAILVPLLTFADPRQGLDPDTGRL